MLLLLLLLLLLFVDRRKTAVNDTQTSSGMRIGLTGALYVRHGITPQWSLQKRIANQRLRNSEEVANQNEMLRNSALRLKM